MRTHCNGAAQLMARVQVRRLFLPEQESDSREAILTAAERCGTEIVFVTEDLTLDFSGGSLRLFAPVLPGSRNCGLAALMSAGEYDILIPGDMPAAAERVLADTHSLPQVEVLVVGHHGAAGSTAPELLQAVSPGDRSHFRGRGQFLRPSRAGRARSPDGGGRGRIPHGSGGRYYDHEVRLWQKKRNPAAMRA